METQSGAKFTTGKVGNKNMNAPNVVAGRHFSGLASDSRAVRPGFLFAALPGARADGSQFIDDAVQRGAVAVLGLPIARARAEALGVEFIADENPRLRLAKFAAAFYGIQPRVIAAVTGTNGKTSVAVFLRQIWTYLGFSAASMGTIGIVSPSGEMALAHTTPDPIAVHAAMARLAQEGVERVALEASSHGLDQYRLHGLDVAAAGFTNITRDHLDYHADFESYLEAKLKLFAEVVHPGGIAVVNADAEHADGFARTAERKGLALLTVGEKGRTLKLVSRETRGDGQILRVLYQESEYDVDLPLAGAFQASNALVAAGLAIGLGDPAARVFDALGKLKGAPGRLEKVAYAKSGAAIYVDYAHTPDALETVLRAIRPHVSGRLHVVFGCGGDRDRGKRPLMGAAAAAFSDRIIVTDDNPRSENPASIRRDILAGVPAAREIGDRADAIRAAIAELAAGDVLVIAGKGHESGQTIGSVTRSFNDRDQAIRAAVIGGGRPAEMRG